MNSSDRHRGSISRGRIVLWVIISLLCAVTFWQWRVQSSYAQAVRRLSIALREVDSATRDDLTPDAVSELLQSSKTTGPIQQSSEQLIVHQWTAPLFNFWVRLHVNSQGYVESFDTLSQIPKAVVKKSSDPNWSPKYLKEITRAKHLRDADAFYEKVEIPTFEGVSPLAITKVQECLKELPDNPLDVKSDTILESQVIQRRITWYRHLWVDSYRQHSVKDPKWTTLAEQFLELAATEVGTAGSCAAVRDQMNLPARNLAATGCDDPLVGAVIEQFVPSGKRGRGVMNQETFDAFYESSYPADVVFLSSSPAMSAKDLIRLQTARTAEGEVPKHELLRITDPIDMRIVYGRVTENLGPDFNSQMRQEGYKSQPLLLIGSQAPVPWIRHMLFGLDALSKGNTDMARECLCNAWSETPENPEPPAEILRIIATYPAVNGIHRPLAGEQPDFWFHQSVRAQFDFPPVYQTYTNWLSYTTNGAQWISMQFAQRCLDTHRFDTDIPLGFIGELRRLRIIGHACREAPSAIKGKLYFGTKQDYEGLKTLVQGYSERPELPLLQSYLACSAYLQGHVQEAASLLESLGNQLPPQAIIECQVTADQIRRSAMMLPQPFQFAPQRSVLELSFSNDGESLMFVDSDGQLHRMLTTSGTIEHLKTSAEHIRLLRVPQDNSGKVFVCSEEKGASLRDFQTLDVVNEMALPREGATVFLTGRDHDYWCIARPDGSSLNLILHPLAGGESLANFSTRFQAASRIDVAASEHLLALIGVSKSEIIRGNEVRAEVWNWEEGKPILSLQPFTSSIDEIALAPNGNWVAIAGAEHSNMGDMGGSRFLASSVKIFELSSGDMLAALPHPASISCLLFDENHQVLITGCVDGIVRLWNPLTGELVSKLSGHSYAISSLALFPEKDLLASGGADGRIRIWPIDSSTVQIKLNLQSQALHVLSDMQMDPLTNDILTESRDEGTVRWQADSNYLAHVQVPTGIRQWEVDGRQFAFRPQGMSSNTQSSLDVASVPIDVLEIGTAQSGRAMNAAGVQPAAGIVTKDRKSLITGGNMPTVWNLETGKPWAWGLLTGNQGMVNGLSLSSDGRQLLTCSNKPQAEVCIWELPEDFAAPDADVKLRLQWHPESRVSNLTAVIAPTGNFFLVPEKAGKIQLREIPTGELQGAFDGDRPVVSPDGSRIAVGSTQYTIIVYDGTTLAPQRTIPASGGQLKFLQWGSDNRSLFYAIEDWIYGIDTETGTNLLGQTSK